MSCKRSIFLAAVVVLIALAAIASAQTAPTLKAGSPAVQHPSHHPSRVLVKFRPGTRDFLPNSGQERSFWGDQDLFLVENPPGLSVDQVEGRYQKNPNVQYVEPDFEVSVSDSVPNDQYFANQWDMSAIQAPAAWDLQTSATGPIAFVIDTGIAAHPDLAANLLPGWTCMNGSCVAGDIDDFGHGTHVAGTIGAVGNNGTGIAGINWAARIMACKFIGSTGSGYISDAISCFDKAVELKQAGWNIRVTSNSWGGGGFDQSLMDALQRANDAGILNICAAGNSGVNADLNPMYPAAFPLRGTISVGASDSSDAGASFSNYGLASVDIFAPGVNTLSTLPTGSCPLCSSTGYGYLSGTSMATPHVTGVAIAVAQRNPALTVDELRDVILDRASYDALSNLRASTSTTGGRLNLDKALTNPLVLAPALNTFPVLTVGPDVVANAGQSVDLTATATDADGDPLRYSVLQSGGNTLLGLMTAQLMPPPIFTAPPVSRTAIGAFTHVVADGRGGSATATQNAVILPGTDGLPPTGSLSASPISGPVGTNFRFSFPMTDPDGGSMLTALSWAGSGGYGGGCCFNSSYTAVISVPMVMRWKAQTINSELLTYEPPSVVIHVGGATGEPPLVRGTLDKLSGSVPFSINAAETATDADGTIAAYSIDCGNGTGNSLQAVICDYDSPGIYQVKFIAYDNSGYMDVDYGYVVATQSIGSPPAPAPLAIATTSFPSVTVGVGYSTTPSATGGVPLYVWSLISGALPPGLSLSGDGRISGTPLAAGTFSFTVQVEDSVGSTASAAFSITIVQPPPPPRCVPRGKSSKCK